MFRSQLMQKFQSVYFKGAMRWRCLLGRPAQTKREVQIFKIVFDAFAHKKINVFEWGSGFSSIYFAEHLRKRKIDFQWHSIDNNKVWHEKIKAKIIQRGLHECVQLHLKEFLPFWEKAGWEWNKIPPPCGIFSPKSENEKAYIDFPKELDKKFDIIIIDARFRRHCLQTAKEALAPGGVVVMHDAQKTHYHLGLDDFPYGKFLTTGAWYPFQEIPNKVWIGSMGNKTIFDALIQF